MRIPFFVPLFLLLFAIGSSEVYGQRKFGPSPLYLGKGKDNQTFGEEALREFRNISLQADFALNFELKVMPFREKSWLLKGALASSQNDLGPLSLVQILKNPESNYSGEWLYLQNGESPFARKRQDEEGAVLGTLERPMWTDSLAGTDVTVFDLLMPFIYWKDFTFEGRTKLRGRPTLIFLLYPENRDEENEISAVRLYLDSQFKVMTQARMYDIDGDLLKRLTVVDIKKTENRWMVGSIEIKNEKTKGKTRIKILDTIPEVSFPVGFFGEESAKGVLWESVLAVRGVE